MKCYRVFYQFDKDKNTSTEKEMDPFWLWADNASQAKSKAIKLDGFTNNPCFEGTDIKYINLRAKREPILDNMESMPANQIVVKMLLNGVT